MTFEYVQNDEVKAREILSRVIGNVFSFNGKFAIDRERDAVVVDLGGNPSRDSGDDEGPAGNYNMHWAGAIFDAGGHTKLEMDGPTYIKVFNLSVTAPRAAENRIEEARRLMELGLAAIESAYYRTEIKARLIFTTVTYRCDEHEDTSRCY